MTARVYCSGVLQACPYGKYLVCSLNIHLSRAFPWQVLERFQTLLSKLSDAERGKLQRSMGMKMEQLKARTRPLKVSCMLTARQHLGVYIAFEIRRG